jgi:hypothetical protein
MVSLIVFDNVLNAGTKFPGLVHSFSDTSKYVSYWIPLCQTVLDGTAVIRNRFKTDPFGSKLYIYNNNLYSAIAHLAIEPCAVETVKTVCNRR